MAFERVFTVDDYYDGARSGIAAYQGQPHHYLCEWDESRGDYSDTFRLTPIDEETFSLASVEQWSILGALGKRRSGVGRLRNPRIQLCRDPTRVMPSCSAVSKLASPHGPQFASVNTVRSARQRKPGRKLSGAMPSLQRDTTLRTMRRRRSLTPEMWGFIS